MSNEKICDYDTICMILPKTDHDGSMFTNNLPAKTVTENRHGAIVLEESLNKYMTMVVPMGK